MTVRRIFSSPVFEQPTDTGQPPASSGAPTVAPTGVAAAPPLPDAGEKDTGFSSANLDAFLGLAQEGGEIEERIVGDVIEAPVTPPAPTTPVAAPAATPAQVAPTPAPVPGQEPVTPVQPPVQPTQVPQAAPGTVAPQPGAAPVVAPVAQPVVTPQAAPQTPVPVQAPIGVDPFAELSKQLGGHKEAYIGAMADQLYGITPEDHEAFVGGDTKKLSQLCARIHYNTVDSVLNAVSKLMPVMVDGLVKVQREADKRESRFWDANPHLDREKHKEQVTQVAQTYMRLNPGIDEAKRFRDIGLLVAQMYNIPLQAQAPVAGQVPVVVAPTVRTPGPVVKQVSPPGFAPASAGGPPPQVQPNGVGPANPWGDFVEIALAAERGALDQ
jgi:hypothetical protein